jgi:hypothetical protein
MKRRPVSAMLFFLNNWLGYNSLYILVIIDSLMNYAYIRYEYYKRWIPLR